jgi:xylan 1,4-beta-xylosidase
MMMARAKCLAGPYEMHPQNPIMTAWETVAPLQKAGHGNLVETPDGQWYGGFLCGRPNKDKRCVLGRETAIERGQWRDDGWFYFDSPHPRLEVPGPSDVAPPPSAGLRWTDDFDGSELRLEWNTLRLPPEAEVSLAARPGWLRLRGLPLPIETDQRQALVARRVQHPSFEAATLMEYRPENAWQYAGLICWYSHASYYWLRVAWHEGDGAVLELVKRFGDKLVLAGRIPAAWPQYQLRVSARGDDYRFAGSADGRTWHNVGEPQDGSILSDEAAGEFGFAFTGSFVGLAAVDISDQGRQADFDWLDYRGLAD